MNAPDRIYLDYNATAPLRARAKEAMHEAAEMPLGNPSSPHQEGRVAHALLDQARNQVATLLGTQSEHVVFTSGGTEAVNAMMRGAVEAAPTHGVPRIVITATDHTCVRETAEGLRRRGCVVEIIPIDRDGRLDQGALLEAFARRPHGVVTHWANNETGVLQDVVAIGQFCEEHDVPLLLDAVQALGKLPIEFDALPIAAVAVSGHKIGGPAGVGALAVNPGFAWAPLLRGGHQEYDRRAGTEPLLAAVGFGAAAAAALEELPRYPQRVAELGGALRQGLLACEREVVEHAADVPRIPNTLNLWFSGCEAEALVQRLDLEGVAIGIGAACASGAAEPSPVLLAMGIAESVARESVRFSLGYETTAESVQDAAARVRGVIREWAA